MPKKAAAKTKTAKPANLKLKASDASKVKGGRPMAGAESCKETGDSGMMGCGTG